ncbi:MAG: malto-oligosyltrehalose trehalohydrolase [Dethiobacteria bacterium]|jgi:maltooligosyltrehalose trehalohydrolase|nr:malto-oligosyltrehalose trehalohydrolase [Bacillota bacterium]HPT33641.1 malto-oligosyltrehalose trehalohydrolase [Bacillota bacterium]HPZ64627.1 malto-oligosyltrehalose trehalohydrolase [Bacillota bacterium]HQD06545.1 malto-oligosyltrehalose trehalohydrolase [Bacillota bacterium]
MIMNGFVPRFGPQIVDPGKKAVRFTVPSFYHQPVRLLLRLGEQVKEIPMEEENRNIYSATVVGLGTDLYYKYALGEKGAFPDPYAHYLPEGVHGYAQVVDHDAFAWSDQGWPGLNLEEAIIYELHLGTFTEEGTFRAAAEKLDYLLELGVNTVEIMPVTQTPGRWNWGYDGVGLYSVNHNYGTPEDFKALVDRCHRKGLAVILDVVYNHIGPEGNYLPLFGPYFTDRYETPWGAAVNYDDGGCEIVRAMVLDNVRYWLELYHLDGLRLDAVHAIKDRSRRHILQEIAAAVRRVEKELQRKIAVIAETDENDVRVINPPEAGGYGMDAQWMDDFHHTVHTTLTGEKKGYYGDYPGIDGLEKVFKNYLYTGEYSKFWKKKRGTDGSKNPGKQFIVAIQTHDQVGNRGGGERLSHLVRRPHLKAAAGLLLVSPYIPMLFMGEEYAEERPFLFFTDFLDPELKKAVSEGRRKEFADFGWDRIPDPEDDETFYRSRLTPREQWKPYQHQIFAFYRDLIALRKNHPALKKPDREKLEIQVLRDRKLVTVRRRSEGGETVAALVNLGEEEVGTPPVKGSVIFNSEAKEYGGSGHPGFPTLVPGQFILIEE